MSLFCIIWTLQLDYNTIKLDSNFNFYYYYNSKKILSILLTLPVGGQFFIYPVQWTTA